MPRKNQAGTDRFSFSDLCGRPNLDGVDCRSRKLGLRVNQEKTADVRFGCVDGFDVDAYRRGLGFVESMHSEINMISVMPTYQQLCLRTTEKVAGYTISLLHRFPSGARTVSPVARHVLATVLSLPPRRSD